MSVDFIPSWLKAYFNRSMLGGVAHLVERYIRIVEVVSSSLIVSTSVPLDPIRPWVRRYFLPLRLDRKRHLFCFIFTTECLGTQTRIGATSFIRLYFSRLSGIIFQWLCCEKLIISGDRFNFAVLTPFAYKRIIKIKKISKNLLTLLKYEI